MRFESSPGGTDMLPVIVEALSHKVKVEVEYTAQYSGITSRRIVSPQFLKQSGHRWYLVARQESGIGTVYALDRMVSVRLADEEGELDVEMKPDTYFDDVVGVNIDDSYPCEKVLVRVSAPQCRYIDLLPLHHSQNLLERSAGHAVYEYMLRPEYEFQHRLLGLGGDAEVLEPTWLRDCMVILSQEIAGNYQQDRE